MVTALTSQQCGPGSNPSVDTTCWFGVACWFSPLLQEVSLWVLQLPLYSKTNIFSKFQFHQESGRRRTTYASGCAISKSLFMVIHSLFYLFTFTMILKNKGRRKKKELTLPYSLVDATWIVGPGNLPVLRTGINGT